MLLLLCMADVILHKGIVRVMLPKKFPAAKINNTAPPSNIQLINTNKQWTKAVNTASILQTIDSLTAGVEIDVYFDLAKNDFDVHHGTEPAFFYFNNWLQLYAKRKLTCSIWLDFKNLDAANQQQALASVMRLSKSYGLKNKIVIESPYTDLLKPFAESGFFTSYYVPYFNPYLISNDSLLTCVRKINVALKNSTVQSLSGYYYQASFLHHYFPRYYILTWGSNDWYSPANLLFKKYVQQKKEILVALYPLG